MTALPGAHSVGFLRFGAFTQRVKIEYRLPQTIFHDMRVDLRRRDIGVSEEESAARAGRRRGQGGALRRHGAAREAIAAPHRCRSALERLRSRANFCRVRWPLRSRTEKAILTRPRFPCGGSPQAIYRDYRAPFRSGAGCARGRLALYGQHHPVAPQRAAGKAHKFRDA